MLGLIAVKHMPIVAKRKPAMKEKGIISRPDGSSMRPKAAITISTIVA